MFRTRIDVHWLPGNARLWYEVGTGRGTSEYVFVDAEKGERRLAFDHTLLAQSLQGAGVSDARPDRLALRDLDWPAEGILTFTAAGKRWRIGLVDYAVLAKEDQESVSLAAIAPEDAPPWSWRMNESTIVTFNNRTAGAVELFWLDFDGGRRSYGAIPAGESRIARTFVAHLWLTVDGTGRKLAVFGATKSPAVAEITGPVAPKGRTIVEPIPLGRAPRASVRTGEPTAFRFMNRADGAVDLFWLDFAGSRQSYGRIAAGQTFEMRTYAGHVWLITNVAGQKLAVFETPSTTCQVEITRVTPVETATSNLSPDGKWSVRVDRDNVILREVATGEEFPLTIDGTPGNAYRENFTWSPDALKLAGVRAEPGGDHRMTFVESSPAGGVHPIVHSFTYYRPGDTLPHPRPVLWDISTRRQIPIDDALFPNPFCEAETLYLRWERDSSRFIFRYYQRGHQVHRMIAVDAATGASSAVIDEQSATFIWHLGGRSLVRHLEDSDEVIWMSERDGWNHLYLYDAKAGCVKHQMTRGEWVVRAVDHVDEKKRQVWFQAGGIVPGQDPYYLHLCRVNFDGSSLVVLTEGDGTHACSFSPDRRYLIDSYSRVDLPPIANLRRAEDGAFVCELERGEAGALTSAGWRALERFVAKGRDGETDIYGVIVRPAKFDPAHTYPVIENIYANPNGAFVPKGFNLQLPMQELANLGFIVVQIDGMGTSHRSKQFHDVCWKNLGDAGLPDRVRWIQAAAAKYPEMDLSRVGIYGLSAGGQSALGALLTHGDFYHVAVSDCGCHDNRVDKASWNEQWMGWPVGPHYAAQSNVTLAPALRGKLLLMVGEMDRNVDPASTMQVVDALTKANKDFELLVVPGGGHGISGTPLGKRRLHEFFVRHLLGREQPQTARVPE